VKEIVRQVSYAEEYIKRHGETVPGRNEHVDMLTEGYLQVTSLVLRDIEAGHFETLEDLDEHLFNFSAALFLLNPFGGDERGRVFQKGVFNACKAMREMVARRQREIQKEKAVQN